MKKKLILLGKSASGKDTLCKLLKERGLKMGVSHTTRPMRSHEIDGIDYHFISLDEFEKLESENFFIESEKFREWKYGRSQTEIEKADMLILTVSGVSTLIKKFGRENFYIVETKCSTPTRVRRSLERGDERNEIHRRLAADQIDFSAHRDFQVDEIIDTQDYSSYLKFISKHFS